MKMEEAMCSQIKNKEEGTGVWAYISGLVNKLHPHHTQTKPLLRHLNQAPLSSLLSYRP